MQYCLSFEPVPFSVIGDGSTFSLTWDLWINDKSLYEVMVFKSSILFP